MIKCFLSDILPQENTSDYFSPQETQQEFVDTCVSYVSLITEFSNILERGIITTQEPNSILFYNNQSLLEFIKLIDDRDLRSYMFSAFSKYPIENYVQDQTFESILSQREIVNINNREYTTYTFPAAKLEKGYIFSIPFCHELKDLHILDEVPLLHKTSSRKVRIWIIDQILQQTSNVIDKIKLLLMKENLSMKCSSGFKHSLLSLSQDEQGVVLDKVIDSINRGYFINPDNKLIKVENASVWAIRIRTPLIRIYFERQNNTLYFASLYKGHETQLLNQYIADAPAIIQSLKMD